MGTASIGREEGGSAAGNATATSESRWTHIYWHGRSAVHDAPRSADYLRR